MKDIAIRAGKTAVQALLANASVQLVIAGDVNALRAALVAGVAAGASVLWNAAAAWSNTPA